METQLPCIAAIATAPGTGAIGIVRLSGARCHIIVSQLAAFSGAFPLARYMQLVLLRHPFSGEHLDQAMVVLYEKNASYTGEESAEIFCHGGRLVLQRVLQACLDAGAILARPGEFTHRAVLHGRMDLVQAEAVGILATAATNSAISAALRLLQGESSSKIAALTDQLLDILSFVEASLDFAEEDGVIVEPGQIQDGLGKIALTMSAWLASARAARPALQGFKIALLGPPNAGKSSLFNALLGTDRAIVHEHPGTTRDVISDTLSLGGSLCMLWDTAGLRGTSDQVETEGIHRAIIAGKDADCRIFCLDGRALPQEIPLKDCVPEMLVFTKADRWESPPPVPESLSAAEVHHTSTIDGRGIDNLRDSLTRRAEQALQQMDRLELTITGARQEQAVLSALHDIQECIHGLQTEAPMEAIARQIRQSIEHVGEISGRSVTEDVLGRIFSRFCIGK